MGKVSDEENVSPPMAGRESTRANRRLQIAWRKTLREGCRPARSFGGLLRSKLPLCQITAGRTPALRLAARKIY
jgi:hypothetical protein